MRDKVSCFFVLKIVSALDKNGLIKKYIFDRINRGKRGEEQKVRR